MTALFMHGTLYAVYNPKQQKYLSKRRTSSSNWSWTDQLEWVHFYRSESDAYAACDAHCQVIPASITMTSKAVVNIEQQRKEEFDTKAERFVFLHRKDRLDSREDAEYGNIRKRLRRLDESRFRQLVDAL